MKPDVQAAASRLRTFPDDIDTCYRAAGLVPEEHRHNRVILAPTTYDLTIGDLHTILAALDRAETPIDRVPTPKALDYLEMRREQHPRTVRNFRGVTGPS